MLAGISPVARWGLGEELPALSGAAGLVPLEGVERGQGRTPDQLDKQQVDAIQGDDSRPQTVRKQRWDREKYNAYMRAYMRQSRAVEAERKRV